MRFEHDCPDCKPLGEYKEFDLYFCEQGGTIPTVIARYGDFGGDYYSGMAFVEDLHELGGSIQQGRQTGLCIGE